MGDTPILLNSGVWPRNRLLQELRTLLGKQQPHSSLIIILAQMASVSIQPVKRAVIVHGLN